MKYTEALQNCLKEIDKDDLRLQDWQNTFAQVKDPRRKQGQRFTLTSILLLGLAAILSNHVSELAIAQWGAAQSDEVKKALGFEKGKTPHQTTIQRLFRKVNIQEIEAAFRSIFLQIFDLNLVQTSGSQKESRRGKGRARASQKQSQRSWVQQRVRRGKQGMKR